MQGQKAILILNDLEKSHRLGNQDEVKGHRQQATGETMHAASLMILIGDALLCKITKNRLQATGNPPQRALWQATGDKDGVTGQRQQVTGDAEPILFQCF